MPQTLKKSEAYCFNLSVHECICLLGLRRFTHTSMNLNMKASDTVSIHKLNMYRYFQGNWREITMGKTEFFSLSKASVKVYFSVLGEKNC